MRACACVYVWKRGDDGERKGENRERGRERKKEREKVRERDGDGVDCSVPKVRVLWREGRE